MRPHTLADSAFGAQVRFRRDCVEIEGSSTQYARMGDEGSKATLNFCPRCGSTVHYTIEGYEDLIAIPVGAFASREFPAPSVSVYEHRMHVWVAMAGEMKHLP